MSIKIKDLTVKNFMSVGNQTQAVDFGKQHLTLVLGENLDQGGDDNGSRNGTGKTTIVNALSYALYGVALTNIKKDNLINKINSKGMLVTLSFDKDGVNYRIERGRRPNLLKFYVNNIEQDSEESALDLCSMFVHQFYIQKITLTSLIFPSPDFALFGTPSFDSPIIVESR